MPRITQLTAPGKIELKQRKSLTAGTGEAIIQVQHAASAALTSPCSMATTSFPCPMFVDMNLPEA